MMDFYTGNGTEDGLSLQEMIECDMRSAMKYENLAHEGLGSLKSLDGLNVGMSMDFEIQGDSSNLSDKALNLGDLSWLQAVNVSQVLSPAENTDPNLLVDPQTGMPIGTLSGPSVTNTAAITVNTSQSQQTLNQVNTNVISTPRLHQQSNGLIQTNRGQFVTIPTTTSNTIPNTLTQNFVQQHQSPSSPSIRQHLQTVHHQHRNLASPNTHVVYQNGNPTQQQSLHSPQPAKTPQKLKNLDSREKVYPKPVYSYSCLIAMALKNSETGCLPVSEIYNFMTGNFPYFKTAPDGWKNSVRHNLSLNKCFEKIENPKSNGNTKKGCLWGMNPAKIEKMEEEIIKWRKKDPIAIKRSMAKPEVLELLEKGQGGCRSPAHSTHSSHSSSSGSISTPSTPTSVNNNNITKVNRLPDTTSAIKTAVNNLSSITSINANINVIQIKPEVTNGMTVEQKAAEEVIYNNLTNDDLSILDNSLTLDPALNDLALQSGFFDDLANDDFNLDELPTSASPLSFSFTTPQGLSSSPLTIQTATAVQGIKEEKMDLSAFGNTIRISGAPSQTANGTTPGGNFLLSRTVSAFT